MWQQLICTRLAASDFKCDDLEENFLNVRNAGAVDKRESLEETVCIPEKNK